MDGNLGLAMIVEDDDEGRYFLDRYSGVHSEQLDMLCDPILTD